MMTVKIAKMIRRAVDTRGVLNGAVLAGAILAGGLLSGVAEGTATELPPNVPSGPQTHVYVYRNDSTFNRLDTENPISHSNFRLDQTLIATENGDSVRIPLRAIDSISIRRVDVPWVMINIKDDPDLEQLVEKSKWLDAYITLQGNGYTDNFGPWPMKIRGRGNSSWIPAKKPYRVKFAKKTSMAGFDKMKNYVFLANYYDGTLMKNETALWLARQLKVAYANHTTPCELWFNGYYKGLFQITEKIGISKESVNIDEETGMLFELSTEYDEDYKFRSAIHDLPVMVKDPDMEEICEENPELGSPEEYLALWQEDFNRAERMASEGKAFEAFDLESFVNYFLLYDIVGNREIGWPKSLYVHKKRLGEEEKYIFGPAWDFDICMNTKQVFGDYVVVKAPTLPMWLNSLFEVLTAYPEFRRAYRARLEWFAAEVYPEMIAYIDSMSEFIEPAAKLNARLWPGHKDWVMVDDSGQIRENVAEIKEWLEKRVAYLLEASADYGKEEQQPEEGEEGETAEDNVGGNDNGNNAGNDTGNEE